MTVSKAFLARAGLIASVVVLISVAPEARDRSETAGPWEARQAREAERRRVESLRRAYEFRRALAHARMRSEGDVGGAMRASTPPVTEAMCPVLADPEAGRTFDRELLQRREQAFRLPSWCSIMPGHAAGWRRLRCIPRPEPFATAPHSCSLFRTQV